MTVPQIIEKKSAAGKKSFSFEVLPPLKGRNIERLFSSIDPLLEFDPSYINITTHRSEVVFKVTPDGLYRKVSERSRPGTVAVAAAIQSRLNIPAVPHMICSGYSKIETEYALIDLSFLGIDNILILRGDKAKHEPRFIPNPNGHAHAIDLQQQVNDFNRGLFIDGTEMDLMAETPFSYGVAGYPEKHEEAPNHDVDLMWLKAKVDAGASYVVTQMFFDNTKYFDFVDRARQAGIMVPIIPGIKPIINLNQLTLLPKVFKVDFPTELFERLSKCTTDSEAKIAGIEWCLRQSVELYEAGVPSIHYYSHNASASVHQVVKEIFG